MLEAVEGAFKKRVVPINECNVTRKLSKHQDRGYNIYHNKGIDMVKCCYRRPECNKRCEVELKLRRPQNRLKHCQT